MHNVDTSEIAVTAESARSDPAAAQLDVHLEGTWNVEPSEVQFQGDVAFPEGMVKLTADFPPFLGGQGRAPTPLAYCFYGAMCCYGSTFATQAAMAGVPIEALTITLDLGVDFRTALGVEPVAPLSEFRFEVEVRTSASEERVAEVKRLTDERCPAIWAMENPVPYSTVAHKVK